MALAHTQISVELREILLSERPDELYAISSKGTVPVLELEDGQVIDESFDIIMWALDQTNTDWMEINPDQQLKMIHANDHEFKPWLDKYKYHQRHSEHTKECYQDQCDAFLSNYNEILKVQPYLIGKKFNF
jgi:glutathione S-transferase